MHHRGVKRPSDLTHIVHICVGKLGLRTTKSGAYRLALNNMGQIRGTPKWLRSRSKMPLQAESLPAADIFLRYLCHFDAAKVDLSGPDPNPAATAWRRRS